MAARIEGEDAQRAGQLVEPWLERTRCPRVAVPEQHGRCVRRPAKLIDRQLGAIGCRNDECGGAACAHVTRPPFKAACPGRPVASILRRARNGGDLRPDLMDAKSEKPVRNGDGSVGRGMLTSLLGYHL